MKKIFWIAQHTFKNLLKDKILYNILAVSLLFLFFGYLASQLVFGHQHRVMLNLGMAINAFAIFAVSLGVGARFLRNEIETKTIYMLLYRPMSRSQYFIGKFFGMILLVSLNLFLLAAILIAAVIFLDGTVSIALVQSLVLTGIEASVLLAMSLALSLWLRPALTWMVGCLVVFLGHNFELLNVHLPMLTSILPNLSILLMSERVYYGEALNGSQFLTNLSYGLLWVFFFVLLGNTVFSKKNL